MPDYTLEECMAAAKRIIDERYPGWRGGSEMPEFIADEVILNGVIYRRVLEKPLRKVPPIQPGTVKYNPFSNLRQCSDPLCLSCHPPVCGAKGTYDHTSATEPGTAVPVDSLEKFDALSATPDNVDSAPRQGESRGKFPFKTYSKSIQFSGCSADYLADMMNHSAPKPSALRRFWQKLVTIFNPAIRHGTRW